MMFDVAGGVLIAAAICGLFAIGVYNVAWVEEKAGWWPILLAIAAAVWIVIAQW